MYGVIVCCLMDYEVFVCWLNNEIVGDYKVLDVILIEIECCRVVYLN